MSSAGVSSAGVSFAGGTTRDVFADFVEGFLKPISAELKDPRVSEVLINGPFRVFVEREGRLSPSSCSFSSEEELLSALRAVAQYLGRALDENHPILEGRLPDGSRLQAVLPPLVAGGACVAIRRHQQESLTLKKLVELDALDESTLGLVKEAVANRKNVLVSGGTGSGKTSLLRCIASLIPDNERVVTIEDARELSLQNAHIVSLESRPADAKGRGGVDIEELFRATLRLRPDRIVIGELRGREALDLIQAMNSGHGGTMSTIHASDPLAALRRLETLALYSGVDLPLVALRAQVATAVDLVIQVERCSSGRRWVKSVAQVLSLDESGSYRVRFLRERAGANMSLLNLERESR